MKYLSQSNCVTKISYYVISVKYWPKKSQILKTDFSKLQTWKTYPSFSNFKFSKSWKSITLTQSQANLKKDIFVEGRYHKKR